MPTTTTPQPCPSPQDVEYRFSDFTARYEINGDYVGSVTLLDNECVDIPTCGEFCTPISAGIDTTLVSAGDISISSDVSDCYDESPDWLSGLMHSHARSNREFTSQVDVSSYFEYLKTKPISTQQFLGANVFDVLTTIFTYYTGTPASLYDISNIENNQIKGPVEGNNTLEELRLLAQAACCDMFVQVGGRLTIEKWKDENSATELVIPGEVIIDAEKAAYVSANTTLIRARGAGVSKLDCGNQTLTSNNLGPGNKQKCIVSGIKTPVVDITLNNLRGTEADIKSATFISDTLEEGIRTDVKDGSYSAKVRATSGDSFGPTATPATISLYGPLRDGIDESLHGKYKGIRKPPSEAFTNNLQHAMFYGYPVPHSLFGLGAYGSETFRSNYGSENGEYADQSSRQQVETVLTSPRISECGLATEEISNKYVYCKPLLLKLAKRRFQEIKLAQNTWNLKLAYYPCLKLNQVVEFTVPETEECAERTIKGIVGGIDISHTTDPKTGIPDTSMSVSIMDLDCLGTSEFTSGNLIDSVCGGEGSSPLNGWTASALAIDSMAQVQEYVFLYAVGTPINPYIYYIQGCLEIGGIYDWSFDYEHLLGIAPIVFTLTGGTSSGGSLLASGTLSGSFVSTAEWVKFQWELINPVAPTYVTVSNLRLTQTDFI